MGGAVARRLRQGGFDVTVFDLDPAAMRRCMDAGTARAASMEDGVSNADVVITSLPTPALVTRTVAQAAELLPEGSIVMDISTIDPQAARAAEASCAEHGVRFVTCALGKTPEHAENGQIPLFVGGEATAIDGLAAVFDQMGEKTYYFNDVEGATTFKLVSNMIGMTNVATLSEGFALARRAGIDDGLFSEALQDTGAVSFQSEVRLPWLIKGDWSTRFSVDLAAKDVGLALEAARVRSLDAPISQTTLEQLKAASSQGYGGDDVVAVARVYLEGESGE
jgi:3-hydroxyisobutyrate dehydrogenase